MKDVVNAFLRRAAKPDAAAAGDAPASKKKSKAERSVKRADLREPTARLTALAPHKLDAAKYVQLFIENRAVEGLLSALCIFKCVHVCVCVCVCVFVYACICV